MPIQESLYESIDQRFAQLASVKTFSEFKKRDVYNTLLKSIETGKVENAAYTGEMD